MQLIDLDPESIARIWSVSVYGVELELASQRYDIRWFRIRNAQQELEQLPTGDYIGRGGEFLYLHVRVKS